MASRRLLPVVVAALLVISVGQVGAAGAEPRSATECTVAITDASVSPTRVARPGETLTARVTVEVQDGTCQLGGAINYYRATDHDDDGTYTWVSETFETASKETDDPVSAGTSLTLEMAFVVESFGKTNDANFFNVSFFAERDGYYIADAEHVEVRVPVTIAGQVTSETFDDPLSNVQTYVDGEHTGEDGDTDADGSYRITTYLPEGEHELRFERFGYETETVTVDVRDDRTIRRDVALQGVGADPVTFTVLQEGTIEEYDWFDGTALEGAEVTFGGTTKVTGADGTVRFEDVEPGTYSYTIEKEGYETLTGSQKITTEGSLHVSAGLVPEGSGLLEIHPRHAGEEVPLTAFDVYVDGGAVDPNYETNQVVVPRGTHTLKLVPVDDGSELEPTTKNFDVAAGQRTELTVEIGSVEKVVTFTSFDEQFGGSSASQNLPAGYAFAINRSSTIGDDRGRLFLATGAGPGLAADSTATGYVHVGKTWTANSSRSVKVTANYDLTGTVMHRNADCFVCNLGEGSFGGLSEIRSSVVVYDMTAGEVVASSGRNDWKASSPTVWSVIVDVGSVLVAAKLGSIAEGAAGSLAANYGLSQTGVFASKVVATTSADALVAQTASHVTSDEIEGDLAMRNRRVSTSFETEPGHTYVLAYNARGYVFSTGIVSGSAVTNMSVTPEVNEIVVRGDLGDVEGPSIEVTEKPPRFTASSDIALAVALDDDKDASDDLEYQYRAKPVSGPGGSWSSWIDASRNANSVDIGSLSDGSYVVQIRARDTTGNIRLTEVPVVVDTTAPQARLEVERVDRDTRALHVSFRESFQLANVTMKYRPEGGDWEPIAVTNATVTLSEDPGVYQLWVRGTDRSGNTGDWVKTEIEIEPASTANGTSTPTPTDASTSTGTETETGSPTRGPSQTGTPTRSPTAGGPSSPTPSSGVTATGSPAPTSIGDGTAAPSSPGDGGSGGETQTSGPTGITTPGFDPIVALLALLATLLWVSRRS